MGEILCGLWRTCRAGFWRSTKKFGCCRPGSMPVRQHPRFSVALRLRWVEDVSSSIGVTNRVLVFWQFYSFRLTGTRPVLKQRSYGVKYPLEECSLSGSIQKNRFNELRFIPKDWCVMKNKKNTGLHRVWLILSVLLAAVTLFGAMYWGPQHNQSTGLYWAIFALMTIQSYSLYKEPKEA